MDAVYNGNFTLAELQLTIRQAEALGFILTAFAQRDEKMHFGNADYPSNSMNFTLVPAPPKEVECIVVPDALQAAAQIANRYGTGWVLVAFGSLYVNGLQVLVAAFRRI